MQKLQNDVLFINVDGMVDLHDKELRPDAKYTANQRLDIVTSVKTKLQDNGLRVLLLNPTDSSDIKIPQFAVQDHFINEPEGFEYNLDYSIFLLKYLYDYISHLNFTHVIVFQYDGYVCNLNKWDDDFLNYDYLGNCNKDKSNGELDYSTIFSLKNYRYGFHMNGGFSLRSRELIKRCKEIPLQDFIKLHKIKQCTNEDLIICDYLDLNKLPKNYTTIEKFVGYEPSNNCFGFHKT